MNLFSAASVGRHLLNRAEKEKRRLECKRARAAAQSLRLIWQNYWPIVVAAKRAGDRLLHKSSTNL